MAVIYKFFGTILGFFSGIMGGSYLLGLLLFAILIKILLLPFGIKQQKTSVRQARIRPKEEAIRRKYKGRNDQATQQKMQQELLEMQQAEGYNPMGGCLPLLLQMVFILLLYQAIIYPLQYVVGMDAGAIAAFKTFATTATDAGGLGVTLSGRYEHIELLRVMIENGKDALMPGFESFLKTATGETGTLVYSGEQVVQFTQSLASAFESGLPSFNLFGMENFLAKVPNFNFKQWGDAASMYYGVGTNLLLILVPILNFGATFFTTKLTKKFTYQPMQSNQAGAGCTGKSMDLMMPVFSLVIAFMVPAAIGIYWLFNSLLGVVQQVVLYKIFPLPVFTEEDIRAAERELAGKAAKAKENANQSISSSSLRSSYLEDDDGDDTDIKITAEDTDDDGDDTPHIGVTPQKPKD